MRSMTTLLTLTVAALAGVVYFEIEEGLFAPLARAPEQVSVNVPASVLTPQREDDAFAKRSDVGPLVDIVERPLFRPDRRPPQVVVETPAPVDLGPKPTDLTGYTLVGTVIAGEQQIALLREAGAAELVELRRGDQLHGWQVDSMLTDTVTFVAEAQTVVMELNLPK